MTGTNINQANQANQTNQANQAEITGSARAIPNRPPHGKADGNTLKDTEVRDRRDNKSKAESELRAAARRRGLTVKEVAALMGVNYGHLCAVANGRRPWTPMLREKAMAVLGEAPGQGVVYRRGGLVQSESTYIRERARELGMTQKDLANLVGVSSGYMSDVARGRRNMSPQVQARVEAVLKAPARIETAVCANRLGGVVSGGSTCIRECARELGMSMGELADLVGVSRSYMTQVARGRRNMSPPGPGTGGNGVGGSGQGRACPDSHGGPARVVGPDGGPRFLPERDGPAGRHQLVPSLPDHERPAKPVGGGPGEAAQGPVPVHGGGAGWCLPR